MNQNLFKKLKQLKVKEEPPRGGDWVDVTEKMLNGSPFDYGVRMALYGFDYKGAYQIFERSDIRNKDANAFQAGWESVPMSDFGSKWILYPPLESKR